MYILAKNIQEIFLARLACAGELPCINILDDLELNRSYMLGEIKRLEKDGIIYRHKFPREKSFFRLSEPNGRVLMSELNEELNNHIELLIGEKGNRYKGSKTYRKKQRALAEIINVALKANIEIDHIGIIYSANVFGLGEEGKLNDNKRTIFQNNKIKTLDEILKDVHPKVPIFLTQKATKNLSDSIKTHSRSEMYRSKGVFISNKNVYPAYYIDGVETMWFKDVEAQYMMHLNRYCKNYLKSYSDKSSKMLPKAMFFFKNNKILNNFILDRKRHKINPTDVYNLSYAIPLDENADDIVKMLLVDKWKEKTLKLFLKDTTSKSGEDGNMGDDTKVYSLLCSNIGRIYEIKNIVYNKGGLVLCHEWQREVLEEFFKDSKCKFQAVSNKQFKRLLNIVSEI